MWSEKAIHAAWERVDILTPEHLLRHDNVREWVASTEDRVADLPLLVDRALDDLRSWGVTPLGILPSGVGGLTLAARMDGRDVVAKWVGPRERNDLRVTGARILAANNLGPEVVAWSSTGLLLGRVMPGVPLRSKTMDLGDISDGARMLSLLRRVEIPVEHDLPSLTSMTVSELEAIGLPVGDNPFAQLLVEVGRMVLPEGRAHLSHGDFQSGNLLSSHDGLRMIDSIACVDTGHFDAARFALHSCVDAWARGQAWDLREVLREIASVTGEDTAVLEQFALFRAVLDGYRVFDSIDREWEWKGYLRAVQELVP